MDYVCYLSTVCEDQLTFSVLSKCLFDLLKSCGHPWHVTSTHFLVTLLNLGARDQLVISEQFYQLNRLPAEQATSSSSNTTKVLPG